MRFDAAELKVQLATFFGKDVRLMMLFGSRASENESAVGPESDLDLGILADRPLDPLAVTNELVRLLHFDRIDVVDLGRADPLLRMQIATKGKVLFEGAPGEHARFVSLACRRYADTAKFRRATSRYLDRFLEERDLA